MRKTKGFGLTAKFNMLSILLVVFTALAVTVYGVEREQNNHLEAMINNGKEVSRIIARFSEYALFSEDEDTLKTIINSIDDEGVSYLALLRTNKTILAEKWLKVEQTLNLDWQAHSRNSKVTIDINSDGRYIQFITPVTSIQSLELGTFLSDDDTRPIKKELLGYVRIVFNTDLMHQQSAEAIKSALGVTMLIVVVAIALTLPLTRRITRPVNQLVQITKKISDGNLNEEVSIHTSGELSYLSDSFNIMVKQLNFTQKEVEERTNDLKKANAKLKKQAQYDGTTGLPNRMLLNDVSERLLAHAARQNQILAVFFLDLDGFKKINDDYGHEAGDTILKEVSQRMRSVIRKEDILARIGGDEFALVQGDVASVDDVRKIAENIIRQIGHDYKINEHYCNVGISIGISMFPQDANNIEDLLRYADEAMYRTKKSGKNGCSFY